MDQITPVGFDLARNVFCVLNEKGAASFMFVLARHPRRLIDVPLFKVCAPVA